MHHLSQNGKQIMRTFFIPFSPLLSATVLLGFIPFFLFGQPRDRFAYIEQYREIAVQEMRRAGIPASIKLAQGILESAWGESTLARRANNHFGIKCGGNWNGKTFRLEDDDYDDRGNLIKSCFRKYRNPEASYVAHSEFLRDPRKAFRYGFLFRLPVRDYRSWAWGLKQAGYATSGTYAQALIRIIEQYRLYEYDQIPFGDFEDIPPDGEVPIGVPYIVRVNDVKMVFAQNNDSPERIAARTETSLRRILKYNEQLTSATQRLPENERVFLQRKRCNYRGREKWHYVKPEETMYDISQLYGIHLNHFYKRNKMDPGTQPAAGERVRIRGRRKERPQLQSEGPAPYFQARKPITAMPLDEGHVLPDQDQLEAIVGPISEESEPEPDPTPEPTPEPDPTPEPEPEPDPAPEPPVEKPQPEQRPEPPEKPEVPEPEPPAVDPVLHTVQKGDTLYNISRRYGTTVEALRALNDLEGNLIKIGQQLRVR